MNEQAFVQFDQGKPFYDMVGAFLIAVASSPAILNADNPMGLTEGHYIAINGVVGPGKHLFPFDVFQQVQQGHLAMQTFLGSSCTMLANTAYESVKGQNDRSPEFEFFRHVRNASSHGNRFTFSEQEPRRPASWRGVVIDSTKKGASNPLNGQVCFGPLIGPADLIDLLGDIETILVQKARA